MRLASVNGSAVEFDIVGYEQADVIRGDAEEPVDWLMIRGRVEDGKRAWTFESSCLDTDDARRLYAWLTGVADGSTAPSDRPGWGAASISFTEPAVRLQLLARAGEERVIRWTLLGEAASPAQRDRDGDSVDVAVTSADVQHAAESWQAQIVEFPPRP